MKQFFKFMFASMFGFLIAGILLLIIGIFIIIGVASSSVDKMSSKDDAVIKENSILHLTLDKPIVDRGIEKQFELNFASFSGDDNIGLEDLLLEIEKAKTDDKIKGIYLDITGLQTGIATIYEIRNKLEEFKQSKKWIVSYSENYTQGGYYLASVSDEVYLYPEGAIAFQGLNADIMFLKGMLEKLDIEAQIIRGPNNKFKSAVEPLIYDKMSEENRLQTTTYVGAIWNNILDGISTSRKIDKVTLQQYADNFSIREPEDALKLKFIDNLFYKDQLLERLKELSDTDSKDDLKLITFNKYKKTGLPNKKENKAEDTDKKSGIIKEKIAVIYASGGISSGEGDSESIGSETVSKAIREARLDSTVKAIVLRINSGGGSALASDVIWRETVLAKAAKPLVVSMGDVAASGGYYIACNADKIFASPTTITGSIGVFGVLPNMKGFLNNKIGVTFDNVKTGKYADLGDVTRPLTDDEFKIIQESVVNIYDDFITKVSVGRKIDKAAVDSLGQGRVWSGVDAKRLGLIDEFGGLEAAIASAAELAKIKTYRVKDFPKLKDPFEKLMEDVMGQSQTSIIEKELEGNYKILKQFQFLQSIKDLKGIQMMMPYHIDIN
jgi:protease IV